MTTVQNKTALVTGASRGIGRATAVALARCEIGALPSPNPEVVTVVPDCSGCACVEYVRDELVVTLLALDRRRVLHFNVTEHPTVAWTAQQIVDAFPDDSAPSYLLRDRDKIYGHSFRQRRGAWGSMRS